MYFRNTVWVLIVLPLLLFYLSAPFRHIVCDSSGILRTTVCSGSKAESWDLFYHLGGNGPWIPKAQSTTVPDEPLPAGCIVDQVHMVRRTFIEAHFN